MEMETLIARVLLLRNEFGHLKAILILSRVKRSFRCSTVCQVCPDPRLLLLFSLEKTPSSSCRCHNEQRLFVRQIISVIFSNLVIMREQRERERVLTAERTGSL